MQFTCKCGRKHDIDMIVAKHFREIPRSHQYRSEHLPHGTTHHFAKLDDEKVREIRASSLSVRALGRKYGVSPTTINQVRTWKTWRHVT